MRRFRPISTQSLFQWMTLLAAVAASSRAAADWTVTPRGSVALSAGAVTGIREFSGVAYIGPAAGGLERFAAIQDSGNQIVLFDVSLAANGAIQSAAAVSARSLAPGADYEGIVFTGVARNSVFVSEESTPGVHEHSLATGARLQSAPLPSVFQGFIANKALESLTRSVNGDALWTANEESLSVDGPNATAASGTTVRLQKFTELGATVTAGPQFAYQVDPIHSTTGPNRSGLVDLVMLPDDTLLALERSAAATLPAFRGRVYQVDFAGATDTSAAEFNGGLAGKSYTPVGKTQLWSGQAGGMQGANLEGLTLGPPLASGNWLLLGVVDNGGSGATTIVSFELAISGVAAAGDFNRDGNVDQSDYVLWKNTYGSTLALAADGNGNQVVDAADYTVWRNHISASAAGAANDHSTHLMIAPEPTSVVALAIALICLLAWPPN